MRKLVIESDKLNVITSYSGAETLETFERFPAVDGVILNAAIHDIPCSEIVGSIHRRAPRLPIIVVQSAGAPECPGADHYVDSFDPVALLELLRKLFPRASAAIKQQDDRLSAAESAADARARTSQPNTEQGLESPRRKV
ncbi:MAG TPA: response regulator [Acidobacteriaceae bacterium]|jgi:DNA-binding NtrC family response regulator